MNTESFFIEDSEILLAQNLCRLITDDNIRNRAVANTLAANIAVKYFEGNSVDVDSASGLHNVSKILDKYDISDIYVKNCYIDVRICFSENELSVPVEHFEKKLLPVAYMFIKLSTDLTEAEVLGFVRPEDVKQENPIDGYYSVPRESLVVYYDIESLLSAYADEPEVDDRAIYSYADGSMQNVEEFLSDLLKSRDARQRFIKVMQAETIFEFVSVNNNVSTIDMSNSSEDSLELNDLSLNQDVDLIEPVEDIIAVGEDIDLLSDTPINESLELNDDSSDSTLYLDNDNLENDVLITGDDTDDEIHDVENVENIEVNNTVGDSLQDFNSDEIQLKSTYDSSENFIKNDDSTVLVENNDIELSNVTNDNLKNEEHEGASVTVENNYYEELENDLVENNVPVNTTNIAEDINDSEMSRLLADGNESILSDNSENDKNNNFNNGFTTVMSSNEEENLSDEAQNNQLDTLFDKDDEPQHSNSSDEVPQSNEESEYNYDNGDIDFYANDKKTKKSGMNPLLIFIFTALVAATVYFGFTKFNSSPKIDNDVISEEARNSIPNVVENETPEAMPNETVEPTPVQNEVNEPTSAAIPAIEQNLDASILVSNLKVFWEVPTAYSSNTSANRYLVKLGKVVQLNLKSELLLLNKPPITNKIAIEISYNPNSRKFEANGITVSSGEKSVDDVILNTVNRALAMNMSMNTDSFAKLQGNPVLIIQF